MIRVEHATAEELVAVLSDYIQLTGKLSADVEVATHPHRQAVELIDTWLTKAKRLRTQLQANMKRN